MGKCTSVKGVWAFERVFVVEVTYVVEVERSSFAYRYPASKNPRGNGGKNGRGEGNLEEESISLSETSIDSYGPSHYLLY